MAATYGERVKVWPELAFAQNNFQNILQGAGGPAQATLYIAFHAVHYSAIFKFRARSRSSPIQDSDNDLAIKVYLFRVYQLYSRSSSLVCKECPQSRNLEPKERKPPNL